MDIFKNSRGIIIIMMIALLCQISFGTDVSHDGRALIIDGQRRILFSGAIHYPRSTSKMWPELLRKAKEGGLDAIETYVFWNAHEPRRREYQFDGNRNIVRFLKEIQNAGLYAVLRIGPYTCAEWNYGGLPVWLHQMPGIQLRTDNKIYENEMQNFTTLIINMVKQEKLLAPQGGPIILAQIENEYGNVMGPYGNAGKVYINWCASLAESLNVNVPWIMCQQNDAPQPMINTCNGFYCDGFKPNNPNSPKMWTENWTGWFKAWDKADPHRPAEDVAFAVARFFQNGGVFQNYYMYHGGTNFGRTAGGPYITTTYDYDAPLDEYGNLRQPKWGHLKELHASLKLMETILTHGNVETTSITNGVMVTKYTNNGNSGCFISNTDTKVDAIVTFEGNKFSIPAWSVSILPDCKHEVYNTAKVTTQTSIMVKKASTAKAEPDLLYWTWKEEDMRNTLKGKGPIQMNKLQEQIMVTGDASDYLWYMTRVLRSTSDTMTLHVNTTGHILHAFVNGELVDSHYASNGGFRFVLEHAVTLNVGINIISLLSVTVGLKNYGAFFDMEPTGIVGGPVRLIASDGSIIDLSSNPWTYKIGLEGLDEKKIYRETPASKFKWKSGPLIVRRPFTWYKSTFKAPLGDDPVVVDLLGMGKGEAWVNGNSIGRFWPNSTATSGHCGACDYRVPYNADPSQCRTGCGGPTQRWYHVPRSFLNAGKPNSLVLFEEAGGDPTHVNLQTVTVGSVCAAVPEGKTMTLSCQGGRTISDIRFASFGDPTGACGVIAWGSVQDSTFKKGSCGSKDTLSAVQKACVGKETCSINVNQGVLGMTGCSGENRLAVLAAC